MRTDIPYHADDRSRDTWHDVVARLCDWWTGKTCWVHHPWLRPDHHSRRHIEGMVWYTFTLFIDREHFLTYMRFLMLILKHHHNHSLLYWNVVISIYSRIPYIIIYFSLIIFQSSSHLRQAAVNIKDLLERGSMLDRIINTPTYRGYQWVWLCFRII